MEEIQFCIQRLENMMDSQMVSSHPIDSDNVRDINFINRAAFIDNNESALSYVHGTLNRLLKLDFVIDGRDNFDLDRLPQLFYVKAIFIEGFLKYLDNQVETNDDTTVKEYWESGLKGYAVCPHPLFDFLANQASGSQLRSFLKQDAAVHVAFADALAAMQIGTRGKIKAEFAHNFFEEVGEGKIGEDHLSIFEQFKTDQNLFIEEKDIMWQALACANLLLILSRFRSLFYIGIGYLGCLEYLTPARFSHIIKSAVRLGIPRTNLRFYVDHAELDIEHGQAWLDEVILQVINDNPTVSHSILKGIKLRVFISKLFWDACLEKMIDN